MIRLQQVWMVFIAFGLFWFCSSPLFAQQKKQNPPVRIDASANVDVATSERKKALFEFVEENHPDLKRLLGLLEQRRPAQFRKAMRTLSRQYDRLQNIERRDPDKHSIALEYWKTQSRIDVLSARISLKGPADHEEQLRSLLQRKQQIRVKLQKYELDRTQERLKKQREALQQLRDAGEAEIEKQLKQIMGRRNKSN